MAKARTFAATVSKNAQLPALWIDLYRTMKRAMEITSTSDINLIPQVNFLLTSVTCNGGLPETHSIRLNNSRFVNAEAINSKERHCRETPPSSPSTSTVQSVGKAILKAGLRPAACIAARPHTDSFRIYHVVDKDAMESSSDTEFESISNADDTSSSIYYSNAESFGRNSYNGSAHNDDDDSHEHYSTASAPSDEDQQSYSSTSPKLVNRSPIISSHHVCRIEQLVMEEEMKHLGGAREDVVSCNDVSEEFEEDVCSEEEAIAAFAESVTEMVIYRRIAEEEELEALFEEFLRVNSHEHHVTIAKAFLLAIEKLSY